jgi:hypothetical protein
MKLKVGSLFAAFVIAATAAQAETKQGGSQGLGFSCDVNTGVCECTGSLEGADCKGMLPNCKVTRPDGTIWTLCEDGKCKCKMFRQAPKAKGPTLQQPRQRSPN